jgi:serine O-acetyltransferase
VGYGNEKPGERFAKHESLPVTMTHPSDRQSLIPRLTDAIVASYALTDRIHHLGHCPLPKYDVVIEILEDFKDLFYPGFRRREGLHASNVSYYVGDLVDSLLAKLSKQITRALIHADRVNGSPTEGCRELVDYEARGEQIAAEMLEKIPAIRQVLSKDVEAAFAGDPSVSNRDEIVFCFPGLEAVTIYRIAHELVRLRVPFIPRMMSEWAHKQTGIDIHPGARIGEYFFIDHGTGVVIGETCSIGNHVKIYQGVTLGALSFATDLNGELVRGTKRHPTIDDHVVIYANATILGGNTTVGHHSVIGSSVWVTTSVAPHTTVVLEKPKVRIRNGSADDSLMDLNYQI